ncbi:MAG: YqeG family HAD IIIA-type phosphatase [Clostridiales bacterium]|jgi:HAD phosphatase, family IIIA|nr:YqeG family HAD IIIA-type phosphatase [Clostridiales bacterium]
MEDKKKEKLYLKYNKYFPTKYVDNILNITSEELIENGIKGVILDLDNTIIDKKGIEVPDFEKWKDKILKNGIKIVIVTNNFLKKRIEKVTNKYNLEYILFARKPNIKALVKAKEMMEIKNSENIAVIGDQVFTDVLRRK